MLQTNFNGIEPNAQILTLGLSELGQWLPIANFAPNILRKQNTIIMWKCHGIMQIRSVSSCGCTFCMAKAINNVVIGHADSLHKGIAYRWSNEIEAAVF